MSADYSRFVSALNNLGADASVQFRRTRADYWRGRYDALKELQDQQFQIESEVTVKLPVEEGQS